MKKAGDILGAFFYGSGLTFFLTEIVFPGHLDSNVVLVMMFGVGSIWAAIMAIWIDFLKEVVDPI